MKTMVEIRFKGIVGYYYLDTNPYTEDDQSIVDRMYRLFRYTKKYTQVMSKPSAGETMMDVVQREVKLAVVSEKNTPKTVVHGKFDSDV